MEEQVDMREMTEQELIGAGQMAEGEWRYSHDNAWRIIRGDFYSTGL